MNNPENSKMVTVKSFKTVGIDAVPIKVEVAVSPGIGIHMVGLADIAVKESLLRSITALQAIGYRFPGKRVVINLAPADLIKTGTHYDLPIIIGIIAASGQEDMPDLDKYIVAGEASLDGNLRMIDGAACCEGLDLKDMKGIILPTRDALQLAEATEGTVPVYGADSIRQVIDILKGLVPDHTAYEEFLDRQEKHPDESAFKIIATDSAAVRAAEIAAAGGHGMVIIGPPGAGKATIAKAVSELLPPLSKEQALECDKIRSLASREIQHGWHPFRAPHYSASMSSMFGGGSSDTIRPGEVSLANGGVLFLDECGLFPKAIMDGLRGPLEDKKVVISRLRSKIEFPADFLPVLASNPCPCGYHGVGDSCTCTPTQIKLYLNKLNGPVFDRTDLQVYKNRIFKNGDKASFEETCKRVQNARKMQEKRYGKGRLNADMAATDIALSLNDELRDFVETLITRLGLSARAYTHMLRLARTIADLDGSDEIKTQHLAEASSYRFLDRNLLQETKDS